MKIGLVNTELESNLKSFGERLKQLMSNDTKEHGGGINTCERGASKVLTKRLYDFHILDYNNYSQNTEEQQRNITGRTVLKHINNEAIPETVWIIRYCKYFHCSADYLLGYIDMPTHKNTDISAYTGLSNDAIQCLHTLYAPYEYGTRDSAQEGRYDIIALNIILEDCYKRIKDKADFATFSDITASILHDIGIYLDSDSAKIGKQLPMIDIAGTLNFFSPGEMVRSMVQNRIISRLEAMRKDTWTIRQKTIENKIRFKKIWEEQAKEIIEKDLKDSAE